MDEHCNLRFQKLEFEKELHSMKLKAHDDLLFSQGRNLSSINKALFQIKWMVAGAIGALLASSIGLVELIQTIPGV